VVALDSGALGSPEARPAAGPARRLKNDAPATATTSVSFTPRDFTGSAPPFQNDPKRCRVPPGTILSVAGGQIGPFSPIVSLPGVQAMGHLSYSTPAPSLISGTSLAPTGIRFRVVPAFSHSYFPPAFLSSQAHHRASLCRPCEGTEVIAPHSLTVGIPGPGQLTRRAGR
jgi:hypothetical protein